MLQLTRRNLLLAALSTLGLGGLAAKVGSMTLGDTALYEQSLIEQSRKSVELLAPRGRILDATGRALAANRPAYGAYLRYPAYMEPARVEQACQALGVDSLDVEPLVKALHRHYWLPVAIKNDLSTEELTRIVEDRVQFADVMIVPHQVRVYPYGSLLAHVLGYTGRPTDEQVKARISPNDRFGRAGLEHRFDGLLHGRTGQQWVQIHSDFTPTGKQAIADPVVPGQDLHLTIDASLQYVAEQALARTLEHIRSVQNNDGHQYKNAQAGALVAMDPRSGAVLAMASHPSFDPNWFISGDNRLNALWKDPHFPALGRAWQGVYNPGSTWKALTSAASLRAAVITPDSTVFCPGVFERVHNPSPHCWSVHGAVNVVRALAGSCDVFFYEMGYRLGVERLVAMAEEFGFGRPTGIDLADEGEGWLPTAAHIAERNKEGKDPWTMGSTIFAAIGQMVEATPLAMARYACTLANGGKVLRPQLVRPVDVDGTPGTVQPDVQATLKLDPELLRVIQAGLRAVTGPGGTAEGRFSVLGVPVAGKTGTAENPPKDPYGIFIAYAPADDPRVAVAVVGEQAGHGDSMIPAVKAVLAAALAIALPPSDEAYIPNSALPAPHS